MGFSRRCGLSTPGRLMASRHGHHHRTEAINNNDALIGRICDARMNFLRHKGWSAHVAEVRAIGKAWATGETPQAANFVDGGQAKSLSRTPTPHLRLRRPTWQQAPAPAASACLVTSMICRTSFAVVLHERVDRQGGCGCGRGTRKRVRRANPSLPVVYISGDGAFMGL